MLPEKDDEGRQAFILRPGDYREVIQQGQVIFLTAPSAQFSLDCIIHSEP